MGDVRKNHLAARFTDRERACIERQAAKQGMGVSEYVRSSVMFMLVMDGDTEALKIAAGLMGDELRSRFDAFRAGLVRA